MDAERLRAFVLTLPHVVETMQWGENLVFWVGDKAIGGKMFCLLNLDGETKLGDQTRHQLLSYAAGPARFHDLIEMEGLVPAPYFARIHWIAAERWDIFTLTQWRSELTAAHALTHAKLPKKVLAALAMPAAAQKCLIGEARAKFALRKTAKR